MVNNSLVKLVNVTEWLEATKDSDISIETSIGGNDGKWAHDRYMRTCTINTGLQELVAYRKKHPESGIRIVNESGNYLVIHSKNAPVKWR